MAGNNLDLLAQVRAQWRWRGADRPPFADIPAQGQISVWDFPGPPELVRDVRRLAQVARSYPQPLPGAEPLVACIAFNAHDLDCSVGGATVIA